MVMDGVIIGAILGAVEVGFVALIAITKQSKLIIASRKNEKYLMEKSCVNNNYLVRVR